MLYADLLAWLAQYVADSRQCRLYYLVCASRQGDGVVEAVLLVAADLYTVQHD